MRKVLAVLLTVSMVLSMGSVTFAASGDTVLPVPASAYDVGEKPNDEAPGHVPGTIPQAEEPPLEEPPLEEPPL